MTKETKDFAQGERAAIVRDISAQGDWVPLIDWSSTFPGNRGVNRAGRYELYNAPVGVQVTIEEARKAGPIFAADQEWDGLGEMVPLCVWQHEEKYHLLYSSHPRVTANPGLGGGHHLCYAVSEDGYNWTRPHLGQAEWEGSTANNIVANGLTGTPFEDPQAPPETCTVPSWRSIIR